MRYLIFFIAILYLLPVDGQHSIARKWNEVLLNGIRNDLARPTVHARNLFHISAAMYDTWSICSNAGTTYLIGKRVHGHQSPNVSFDFAADEEDVNTAISYAVYRLLRNRFSGSPGASETLAMADSLFIDILGLDPAFSSGDYSEGSFAALGNHIAEQYISYGHSDGSNQSNDYKNIYYKPSNEPLNPKSPGNLNLTDPNRWQPLAFDVFIDQGGNEIPGEVPEFLSPEWGSVSPFSLKPNDAVVYEKENVEYMVYFDPGIPPHLDDPMTRELYQWGFAMVAIWSGHLDTEINKIIDISPGAIGNIDLSAIPTSFEEYENFYSYVEGGDIGAGHLINPKTSLLYDAQFVKLGDYGRVLAEFWADGPDSETPPGHWFTILNYINDHPDLEKRMEGGGPILDDLEWDIKAYFLLGGAMHDAAIAAWGIKGYYDYIRPISAIRYMAEKGQSSDPSKPNYDEEGIPLVDGYIELVKEGDPLENSGTNLHKVKLYAWKGHNSINDPETDVSGVGWVLAENWWPYQRPSFVTPPFAGYVSGHSTFSRAAAEILTALTGDPFFPGGIGEFEAPVGEFLVFEDGPSENLTLQWATYRDASDQCSLSRIWGGIHPPADDLPGRLIGEEIGKQAFNFGLNYFNPVPLGIIHESAVEVYPNPTTDVLNVSIPFSDGEIAYEIKDLHGRILKQGVSKKSKFEIQLSGLKGGTYLIQLDDVLRTRKLFLVR